MEFLEHYKSKIFFRLIYHSARIGLAITFIISGIRKMPGVRFTILGTDNPVGFFFEAMYQTGIYWHFIGVFQILAAILLMIRRTVPLATLMILPVTVNIFMITIGLNMRGTPIIAFAMILGNILIILWNYKVYLPLVAERKT